MKQWQLRLLPILSCIFSMLFITPDAMAADTRNLQDRIERLEAAMEKRAQTDKWFEHIQLSGAVEIEAAVIDVDSNEDDIDDGRTSDIDLANAELAVDALIAEYVDGHVLIKYDGDMYIDEGFVTLHGPESLPAYLIVGKQYIPFGNFASHFITDSNTLILGETNEGALIAGYRLADDLINLSAGVYNSEVQEEDDDDDINSIVAAVQVQLDDTLNLGISYTSNIAGSNVLRGMVLDYVDQELFNRMDTLVGGWSVFAGYRFLERFKVIVEYVGALDEFKFDGVSEEFEDSAFNEAQPSAWNTELGITLLENLEVALRLAGSEDGGAEFIPESQYGLVINWCAFKNTLLALEYLHSEYEDDAQEVNAVTAQLAVEF